MYCNFAPFWGTQQWIDISKSSQWICMKNLTWSEYSHPGYKRQAAKFFSRKVDYLSIYRSINCFSAYETMGWWAHTPVWFANFHRLFFKIGGRGVRIDPPKMYHFCRSGKKRHLALSTLQTNHFFWKCWQNSANLGALDTDDHSLQESGTTF